MIVQQCVPYVIRESTTLNYLQSRIHGLDHWYRVYMNAVLLGAREDREIDMDVVGLYALFHDSMRVNDGADFEHGNRGYRLWERYKQQVDVTDIFTHRQEELLFEAILEHSHGERSTNPTIGVCWDADRLDLHRKALWPDARYMSTAEGIAMCMQRINR